MASELLYVRNTRPNAVLVKYNNLKYTVERRGSREDTTALPGEARDDPGVASFITRGILEEISKEAFYQLGARPEGRPAYALVKKGEQVNLPHSGETSSTPFVLADKTIEESRHLRTPRPEFAERVPSTAEEMASGIRNPLPELKRAVSSLESKEEKLESQVKDLTATVAALSQLVEKQLAAAQQAPGGVEVDDVEASKADETPAKKTRATSARK